MATPLIRRLTPEDAAAFLALRVKGLRESPAAFLSCPEEEAARPIEEIAARLADDGLGAVFAAGLKAADSDAGDVKRDAAQGDAAEGEIETLIGLTGVRREDRPRTRHKAWIWGVYVDPAHRGRGVGRQLVTAALDFAFQTLEVRQVNLGVNVANPAAIRLYETLGFETFGLEKAFMLIDGQPHDELHMVCRRGDVS